MNKSGFILAAILLFSTYSFSQTTWFRVSDSIPNMTVMSMQFTSANTGYASCSYRTNWPGAFLRTTNAGLNWQVTQYPNFSCDAISFLNDNTGYMNGWNAYNVSSFIFKTTNGGINWVRKDSTTFSYFMNKFYDVNTGIVVAKYGLSRKTTDGGETWNNLTYTNWREPSSIACLDANTWLVADGDTSLYKTTDGGYSWAVISSHNLYFQSLYFINSTTGFNATTYDTNYHYKCKIYKTTNAGVNWTHICSIDSLQVRSNIMFADENTGYFCGIGNKGTIFKTTNGGYKWTKQKPNPDNTYLSSIYFINANTGFAGDNNGVIYKTTTGGEIFTPYIPSSYSLSQNYPNPFNLSTNIIFAIPVPSYVNIAIYNLSGRKIETLISANLPAGEYQTQWNASRYSSGVYFYRLISGDFKEAKKMVLIK